MQENRQKNYDLTEGKIINKLLLIALPIIGTNVIEMIYNMADMFWLGNALGSDAVASTSVVGMYMWLAYAFIVFGRSGGEIGVSQSTGKGDIEAAKKYGQTAIFMAIILGTIFSLTMIIGRKPLIGFFGLSTPKIIEDAQTYMWMVSLGMPFVFIGDAMAGIFIGSGNSKIPFIASGVGLGINMLLDPIMIMGMKMGVVGAALSTIIGQIITASILFFMIHSKKHQPFKIKFLTIPSKKYIRQIFKWALPISIESFLFTFLSMMMTRIVTYWGEDAMAAMRIGGQIESLSWLIGGGFASALTSFVGQNFGAKKWDRIEKGFKLASLSMVIWGLVVSILLFISGEFIFTLFLPNDPNVVLIGTRYIKILAFSQIFTCLEGIAAGALRGLGDTLPSTLTSGTTNAMRLLVAYVLAKVGADLHFIWVTISMGAALRGLWIVLWYHKKSKRIQKTGQGSSAEIAIVNAD